jgi:hypothetical protein
MKLLTYQDYLMKMEFPTYLLDLEQPTTCPLCGARTDFNDIPNNTPPVQLHTCLSPDCGYQFLGEFDEDELKVYEAKFIGS